MKELIDQLTSAWESLSLRQKVSLFVSVGMTVGAVMIIVWWARLPTWTPLQTGLDPKDAQSIITELQTADMPLRTTDGGATVEVPIDRVDEATRLLASKDLLVQGGLESDDMVLDTSLSESTQTIDYRKVRALERRLAGTLESMTWVRRARVHVTLSGGSPFIDDNDVSKASVQLHVRRGHRPTSEQAQSVVNILRDGVPELSQENVSVVDQDGRLIYDGQRDSEQGGVPASRQLEVKNEIERDVARKLAVVLAPIVGPDNYRISANAVVDHQKVVRELTTYDPEGSVPASEQKTKQKSNSGRGGSGIPGTASNLPGGTGPRGGGTNSTESSQSSITNYVNSFEKTLIHDPTGKLERLSVSVALAQRMEAVEGEEPQPVDRSPEKMQEIEDLLRAAMGFDETRGDVLKVTEEVFQKPAPVAIEEAFEPLEWLPLIKWPALVLLALAAFFLFFRPVLRTVQQMVSGVGQRRESEATAQLERQLQLGAPSRIELLRQRLAAAAQEQPEGMAQTMRLWLHEEHE